MSVITFDWSEDEALAGRAVKAPPQHGRDQEFRVALESYMRGYQHRFAEPRGRPGLLATIAGWLSA